MNILSNNQEKIEYLKKMGFNYAAMVVDYDEDNQEEQNIKFGGSRINELIDVYEKFKEKEQYINDMLQSIKEVKDFISKYEKKSPICFDISLVGGALRDLIIKPENIKDLDILVNIGFNEDVRESIFNKVIKSPYDFSLLNVFDNIPRHKHTSLDIKKKLYITTQELLNRGFCNEIFARRILETTFDNNGIEEIPIKLLSHLMRKDIDKTKMFSKDIDENAINKADSNIIDKENYIFSKILTIVKMNTSKYDVDLIFSVNGAKDFIDSFDFEICKLYANVTQVKSKDDFIKNIYFDKRFWNDYSGKIFTMQIGKFSDEEVQKTMQKHFLNLKTKYMNYKLNISFGNVHSLDDSDKNKAAMYYSQERAIELDLELKNQVSTKKKMKI